MKLNNLFLLSIISSILVILYQFFQWNIVEILTPFLMLPIWLVVFGFFLFVTVITITRLIKNKDWKPIAIQSITVLLLLFFPFNQIVLDIDFKMNSAEREAVVKMVETGTLKPNVPHNSSLIHLPEEYNHLSKGGGEVVVEKMDKGYIILFFTYRGILDNFSGFLYTPNGQTPSKNVLNGDFKEIKKLDKNWYFVSSS
jgi:hypothetical protein